MIAAEIALVFGIFLDGYYLGLLAVPLILFQVYSARKKRGISRKEVLILSRRLLGGMNKGEKIRCPSDKRQGNGSLANLVCLLLKKERLGELDAVPNRISGSRQGSELLELVAFHLNTGKEIKKSLALFCKRLENEIEMENRLVAKVGGMQTLTYAGLVFFLPLFGGISSSILGASLNVLNQNALVFQQHFLFIIACYIAIILCISTAFRKPNASLVELLYSVMPLLTVSLSVLCLTAHYATDIL
jgi:hypothetical protein